MGKILSKAELRKNEIMTAAQSLFYENGYDNTSINLIIETLGISKGAFYHYFKSKEDLLDQLADKFIVEILDKLNPIVEDKNLNALEKLNRIYRDSSIFKAKRFDFIITLIKAVYCDKNLILRNKFNQKSIESSLPVIADILRQGKEEGLFKIDDPEITARLILIFGSGIGTLNANLLMDFENNPANLHTVLKYFREYQRSVEKILGAPQGSIEAFDKTFLDTLQAYHEEKK
jgi:AcrR family transcriptional regulator